MVPALGAATFAVVQARRVTSEEKRATAEAEPAPSEAEEARRQQALAEARELAARSTAAEDSSAALLLAIAAEQRTPEPTQESLDAYVAAVQASGAQRTLQRSASRLPSGRSVRSTTRPPPGSSPSGEYTVQLRTPAPGSRSEAFAYPDRIRAGGGVLPDGAFLAVGGGVR